MKNHFKAALALLLFSLCSCSSSSSQVLMPDGQPLPAEQSAALAALRTQKGVTITSTGPDHISWNTKPATSQGAAGMRMSSQCTRVGFQNGLQTGELNQTFQFTRGE